MGCFLDDLRAFGINADQWTTAPQDEGEWRRTAKQGAEHFMAKWIVAEETKAGLRHAVIYPNVTGRTKKRIAQSKRARAGLLALVIVVVVVVSHIQRIGCQPEKTTLHGGQSRSWSAERGKENKRKSLAAYPPPHPPHCSFGENK